MKTRISHAIIMVFWATVVIAQNNVGIGTTNPTAKLDVRGNGIGYDVFNASNDKAVPFDSIISLSSSGHMGIGTSITGNYQLVSVGRPAAFSPQVEVWQGNPNTGGSSMLADINDVGGLNGCLNLYLAGLTRNVQLRAQGDSYFNGGKVGIGLTSPAALLDVSGQGMTSPFDVFWAGNDMDFTLDSSMVLKKNGFVGLGIKFPQERLHLNGAIVLGVLTSLTPVAGTIHFAGGSPNAGFMGYNGTNWVALDVQWDGDWIIGNGIGGLNVLYNVFPGPVAVSSPNYIPPIPQNQYAFLYVNNNMPPGPANLGHQLLLDDITGNYNASQGFLITNPLVPAASIKYSQGIYNGDGAFKVTFSGTLLPTTQGDGVTMARYNPSGIADLPNQSRARAYQLDPNGTQWQTIQPGVWTPVNFNNKSPLPNGYDQQNEFIIAGPNAGAPPENSYFIATKEGYYQVNARCEFNTQSYYNNGVWSPVTVNAMSYVSIAIYSGPAPGFTTSYAIGNNLQIGYMLPAPSEAGGLDNNNAPNVSDVIYLNVGDIISIWVLHTAVSPMTLIQGANKLYVSIHKVS